MRICYVGLVDIEIKEKSEGTTVKHIVSGGGSDKQQNLVNIYDTLFTNVSYFITKGLKVCEQRLRNNLSDFSSGFMSMSDAPEDIRVPVAFFSGKTSFISGVNLTTVNSKDDSSALSNFSLMSRGVYLSTLLLVMMCILLIIAKVLIQRHHRMQLAHILEESQRSLNSSIKPRLTLRRSVSRCLWQMFFESSNHFRIISLVLAVLAFYDSNTFRAVYKTSQVVVDEPASVKSYEDLINHDAAEPMFYDGLLPQSQEFEKAPRDSVKGKIWQKFEKMGRKCIWYEFGSDAVLSGSLDRAMVSMVDNSSVFIQTRMMAEVFRTFFCFSTPQGRRWRFAVLSDQSEREFLLGPFVSLRVDEKLYTKKVRRIIETDLIFDIINGGKAVREYATMIKPSSLSHQRQQREVCDDHFEFDSINSHLAALPLKYYNSFFILLCTLIISSWGVLLCEVACPPKHKSSRRKLMHRAQVAPHPVSKWRVEPLTG